MSTQPEASNQEHEEYPFNVFDYEKDGFKFVLRCNGYTAQIMLEDIKRFADVVSTRPSGIVGFYVTPYEIPDGVEDFVRTYRRTIIICSDKDLLGKVNEQAEIARQERQQVAQQLEAVGCEVLSIREL
ncbi:25091_t:CDS:1 [Cetraspora pellucida]|uniref:25091_t:CDS:1 n=1 Tax=Cetraspora pellucida TaxID=1433469 RepID=A0A9N9JB50_9GLOM|nr:25091_t:CDS:1 [Cetraspora pellucida]